MKEKVTVHSVHCSKYYGYYTGWFLSYISGNHLGTKISVKKETKVTIHLLKTNLKTVILKRLNLL